jgi:hypothetical protein
MNNYAVYRYRSVGSYETVTTAESSTTAITADTNDQEEVLVGGDHSTNTSDEEFIPDTPSDDERVPDTSDDSNHAEEKEDTRQDLANETRSEDEVEFVTPNKRLRGVMKSEQRGSNDAGAVEHEQSASSVEEENDQSLRVGGSEVSQASLDFINVRKVILPKLYSRKFAFSLQQTNAAAAREAAASLPAAEHTSEAATARVVEQKKRTDSNTSSVSSPSPPKVKKAKQSKKAARAAAFASDSDKASVASPPPPPPPRRRTTHQFPFAESDSEISFVGRSSPISVPETEESFQEQYELLHPRPSTFPSSDWFDFGESRKEHPFSVLSNDAGLHESDLFGDTPDSRSCLNWLRSRLVASDTVPVASSAVKGVVLNSYWCEAVVSEEFWTDKVLKNLIVVFHPDKWSLCGNDHWIRVAKFFHRRLSNERTKAKDVVDKAGKEREEAEENGEEYVEYLLRNDFGRVMRNCLTEHRRNSNFNELLNEWEAR